MKLGLNRDEVRLVDYTPEWKNEFNRVKEEILLNVDLEDKRVEHVGSTAIEGMAAKPILDIVVGVDDVKNVDREIFAGLKNIGFLRLRVERPNEIVLAKFTDDTYEAKTHYIHLVDYQQELWNNLIFFRDYLNAHETEKKRYLQIKQEYVKNSSTGIQAYTDHKEAFVREIYSKRT